MSVLKGHRMRKVENHCSKTWWKFQTPSPGKDSFTQRFDPEASGGCHSYPMAPIKMRAGSSHRKASS